MLFPGGTTNLFFFIRVLNWVVFCLLFFKYSTNVLSISEDWELLLLELDFVVCSRSINGVALQGTMPHFLNPDIKLSATFSSNFSSNDRNNAGKCCFLRTLDLLPM